MQSLVWVVLPKQNLWSRGASGSATQQMQAKQILCHRPHRSLDKCKDRNRHIGSRLAPSKRCCLLHCIRRLVATGLCINHPAGTADREALGTNSDDVQAEHAGISKSLNKPSKYTVKPGREEVPDGNGSNCPECQCRRHSNSNSVALCELRLKGTPVVAFLVARYAGNVVRST